MGIKNKLTIARNAVDQTHAIQKCILCRDRQTQIEAHHPQEKSILGATRKMMNCKECKPIIQQIISCAKMGHVIPNPLEDEEAYYEQLERNSKTPQ